MNFPTVQELKSLPLTSLRNLNIESRAQEEMVQAEVNDRILNAPSDRTVYRGDVPFQIKSREEEAKWQKILDERAEAIKNLAKAPFCEFCTSKGVRHLKICTRPK